MPTALKERARSSFRESRRKVSGEWYKPGVSLQAFHRSKASTRVLVGGRGSGKTTSVAVEAIRHCRNYAGAKVLLVRKTQVSNDDTSVATFNECYDKMGFQVDLDEDLSLFRKWHGGLTVRIPSRDAVEAYAKFRAEGVKSRAEIVQWIKNEGDRLCSYLEFRGLKDEDKAQGQLRGYECSMFVMVEADLLDASDLDLAVGCLRWKDAYGNFITDYSVILDTNPPSPRHWIAKLEAKMKKAKNVRYDFWHIRTDENRHNLPPLYIENLEAQYEDKPAHRRRYLLGEYAELFEGSPVFHAFREERHAFEDIAWPKGAYLVRGWDFGSTHAVIFSAYFRLDFQIKGNLIPVEYWWDLHEYFAEMSDVDRQCANVKEITDEHFPFWNDRDVCNGVMDFCDPAGAAKTDKGSSLEVLNKNGYWPIFNHRLKSLDTTISIVNRLMKTKDPNGRMVYRVDKKNCPRTYTAHLGQYRYPMAGEAGYGQGEPLKGPACEGADHVEDAGRYAKINCLRLAKVVTDELKAKTGLLALPAKKLNRLKKDY